MESERPENMIGIRGFFFLLIKKEWEVASRMKEGMLFFVCRLFDFNHDSAGICASYNTRIMVVICI